MVPKFLITIIATFLLFCGVLATSEPTRVQRRQDTTATPVAATTGQPTSGTDTVTFDGPANTFLCLQGWGWDGIESWQCCGQNQCCYFVDWTFQYNLKSVQAVYPVGCYIYESADCSGYSLWVPESGVYNVDRPTAHDYLSMQCF